MIMQNEIYFISFSIFFVIVFFFLLKQLAGFKNKRISYVLLYGFIISYIYASLIILTDAIKLLDSTSKIILATFFYLILMILYQYLYSKFKKSE